MCLTSVGMWAASRASVRNAIMTGMQNRKREEEALGSGGNQGKVEQS